MLEDLLKLSYYSEIAILNKSHGISLVQHIESGRTFVKKEMTIYNRQVFEQLMEHPISGIPKIFEICEHDGVLTVIEEYISGVNLSEYLDKKGTLSESEVIQIISQLCNILTRLHSFSPAIIHRDIKPSNIMLTDDKRIILIDLNGAKSEIKGQSRDTELIGTHGYAAPEQYGFGSSNIQTDIFSVGKLMVVMLTGDVDGFQKYHGQLKSIIERCLNIDPKNRYKSAQHLKTELQIKPLKKKSKLQHLGKRNIALVCSAVLVMIIVITAISSFKSSLAKSNLNSPTVVNFENAESFEAALNNGDDLNGKTVTFTVQELHPNSIYGYNIWAGEHLNFISKSNPNINEGETVSVRATKIKKNILGSWIIKYELLDIIKGKNEDLNDTTDLEFLENDSSQVLQDLGTRPTPVSDYIESPIGAYVGNGNEILVIAEDGLAYYYCNTENYTELECPWTQTNENITISFSKMHCNVSASTKEGCASLIFRSDSLNWDTEEFIWITSDYEPYIKETPPSVNKDVTTLKNGNMQITIDNIQFTIPKNFIDYNETSSLRENGIDCFCFLDNNTAKGYMSTALFFSEKNRGTSSLEKNYKKMSADFASQFIESTQIGHCEPVSIAGYKGYSVIVSGLLNDGFNLLTDTIVSGPVYVMYNDTSNHNIYLFFPQVVGTDMDNSEYIQSIINSAQQINN